MSKEFEQTKNLNFNTLASRKVEANQTFKEGGEPPQIKFDDTFHIVLYQNLYSKGTDKAKSIQWSDWIEFLKKPKISDSIEGKYNNGLVIYGDIKSGIDEKGQLIPHKRAEENVKYRNMLSFDYDDLTNIDTFLNTIDEKLKYWSYFIYSTYRHTTEKPRFRLLIPLADKINGTAYREYAAALSNYIGIPIDESCFNPIQLSALPVTSDVNNYFTYHNDAPFMTQQDLEGCLSMYQEETHTQSSKVPLKQSDNKRHSQYWKSISGGVGEGERNASLASITGHLLRRYVDPHLVYGLIMAWAETCTPPINHKEVNKTFNSIMRKHLANDKRKEGLNDKNYKNSY